ncbi:MAG: bifunctional 5,10-methylenetetrahydrofolate dehydrogenase/5,10-methenyltetrahydrofolate cyclohydrolase [Candidatus Marinimicrobia bacterium]|nr:bifunctional 5,10-methylenetetrahydrofolate dehydrogenase/5,10-methenyltetrahydrofolate cyclohydrolase [Candidatus Neomarinimicrobiota bacterium]
MSEPLILSGKDVSQSVYKSLLNRISQLKDQNITPGLAVVIVGEDPASQVYVRSKTKKFKQLNLNTESFKLPNSTSEDELLNLIHSLNKNDQFHGILVQLPLPRQIDSQRVLETIDPKKDVDGFHPENVGLLSIGRPRFVPCTPKGIMRILSHYNIDLKGKHVVVVGRSNIVGRPISILTSLKQEGSNGTTTICHSGTPDIAQFTQSADVIIVALGVPQFLTGEMLKDRAIVIDVGINRMDADTEKGYKLVGDAHWESISSKISAATPVPGGVGPMTIAMLVENTVEAAENSV